MEPDRRVLIDTSIMVDLFRGLEEAAEWIDSIEGKDRVLSFITVAELIAGCRNKNEQKKIENEFRGYLIIYPDSDGCAKGLEWYRKFHLSHSVGFLDCLIAASAYSNGIPIATLNERHFRQFPGVSTTRPY